MQSIFQLDSKLLALHSNFNFIQFVFTIYYFSVFVCILRFEGISLTFVHVSRIHRHGRAHTANTLVCINDFQTLNDAQYTFMVKTIDKYEYEYVLLVFAFVFTFTSTYTRVHIFYVLTFSTLMFCLLFASGCFYSLH